MDTCFEVIDQTNTISPAEHLHKIELLDTELTNHFEKIIEFDKSLTRQLVSFQANKRKPTYRWYRYKEAFSASLVAYLLRKYNVPEGRILDPFTGIGTTLFAASEQGYPSDGIEVLPVGQQIITNRKYAAFDIQADDINTLRRWRDEKPWISSLESKPVNELRITVGAYPPETEREIGKYLFESEKEKEQVAGFLQFALLCVLESVSFTRKDGQYLRWDHRSGRRNGKNTFNKGKIYTFKEAITLKLDEILLDLANRKKPDDLFSQKKELNKDVNLIKASCLDALPSLEASSYNAIITSPPYCNRYDYTRTYALEHALIGITEEKLVELRQKMLTCTVENRAKDMLEINPKWNKAILASDNQKLLQQILEYLEQQRIQRKLNNTGIPRMVKGYFYEMSCVIQECLRVLKNKGVMFMVNDNVRYAGASISVDLILSSIAENLGFIVDKILVLPQGKGNSSQQMGQYGRNVLRKCIYVWRKCN